MKKQLLTIAIIFIAAMSFGQVTCDPQYQDSTYGAWPDTTTNLDTAYVNVAYLQVLNFKAPNDAGEIDPNYSGATIESYQVTDVTGLPTGFSYACSATNCTYQGEVAGCANLTGTGSAAQIGTYDITIKITAQIDLGVTTLPVPQDFTGYRLVIKEQQLGVELLQANEVSIYPNPASSKLNIVNASNFETMEVYDINGQLIINKDIEKLDEIIDISSLESGIYLLKLKNAGSTKTMKFSKK